MENNINNPEYQKMMQERIAKMKEQVMKASVQSENINQKIGSDLTNNENLNPQNQNVQPIEKNEEEKSLENPEELKVPDNFKELDRDEQIKLLKEYMEKLSAELLEENKEKVIEGNYEVRDISYNELSDGSIVLDVEVLKDGEVAHEQYNKDLNKIDIDKEIETLRENGVLTPELEEQMLARKEELEQIKDNPEKISLNELETEKTLEDDEKRKQIEIEAENMGIDKEEINGKNVELDDKGDPKFKASMLEKYGQVTYIDGKSLASQKQTFNEITGQSCDQYAIYRSETGYKIQGIRNGKLVDLTDQIFQDSGQRNVSMTRPDGNTQLAASMANFRFRQGGGLDGKYSIGIANVNGRMATYMGREGSEHNQIIAQEFPRGSAWTKTYENEGKDMLDTRVSDEKINDISENMENATRDGISADTKDMMSKEDIIKEYSDYYGVDVEELEERVDEDIKQGEDNTKEMEEIVQEETDEMLEEEKGLNDHGERDPADDEEMRRFLQMHKPQD